MLVAYSFLSLEDFASAERWYKRAAELGMSEWRLANEKLHWLLAQDRFGEADGLLSRWQSSDSIITNVYLFGGLYRAVIGQYSAAIAMLERAAAMNGGMASLHENSNLHWGYMPAVHLAYLYMVTGSDDQGTVLLDNAEKHIQKIEKESPGIPGSHYVRASIHALRGNDRGAIRSLQRAASAGWVRPWFAERDPIFAPYRGHEEFRSVLDQMRGHLAAERQKLALLTETDP